MNNRRMAYWWFRFVVSGRFIETFLNRGPQGVHRGLRWHPALALLSESPDLIRVGPDLAKGRRQYKRPRLDSDYFRSRGPNSSPRRPGLQNLVEARACSGGFDELH